MKKIKYPNVSGSFYPEDPTKLRKLLENLFNKSKNNELSPKVIIAPHAGLIYSGEIAANAYRTLDNIKTSIKRVVVLSPTHYFPFNSLATCSAEYYQTPLGNIELDHIEIQELVSSNKVEIIDEVFEKEHALEVHLPFLQYKLKDFKLIPIIVGQIDPQKVLPIFESFSSDDTLFIVSSDLSHFHDYQTCQQLDSQTSKAFEDLDFNQVHPDGACGYYPLGGLFLWANKIGLKLETIDLRNSGDTAGDKGRVVGYGAYILF